MACKDSKLKKCIDKYNTDKTHSDDMIGAFSVGNAFKGKYVVDHVKRIEVSIVCKIEHDF